jgi:hypothetical protein
LDAADGMGEERIYDCGNWRGDLDNDVDCVGPDEIQRIRAGCCGLDSLD